MGAAFDKWLARPSTLHFLRQLIGIHEPRCKLRCHTLGSHVVGRLQRRSAATAAVQRVHERGDEARRKRTRAIRTKEDEPRVHGRQSGFDMSPRARVALLSQESDMRLSVEDLQRESDVNNDERRGGLLVDKPENKSNARLWIEILRFRQRLDGIAGTSDVWSGICNRSVDLPVSGEEADILWGDVVNIATVKEDDELLDRVVSYAITLKKQHGLYYDKLYALVIGQRFRFSPRGTVKWHFKLVKAGLAPTDALECVVTDAIASVKPTGAFESFQRIYKASPKQTGLYDYCFREIADLEDEALALKWHRFFIGNGDGPSSENLSTTEVLRLFTLDKGKSLPLKVAHGKDPTRFNDDRSKSNSQHFPLNRATMNAIVGDVHGIKAKTISDSFCAKLFATRAFSLDLVIKSLSFFGVEKLGPLALREMAVRSGSHVEFCNKLGDLRTHGIATDESVFTRLITKLANEGQVALWTALLDSDQHPEAYEDAATQEALLLSFLEQDKFIQSHLTLISLSLAGSYTSSRAWNVLLQHYLRTNQHRPMLNIMQSIRSQDVKLTMRTLTHLHRHLLPLRRPSKRYVKGSGVQMFDQVDFVTNALIYAANHRTYVNYLLWVEQLKRYGMEHRWDDLERLVLYLLDRYLPKSSLYPLRPKQTTRERNENGLDTSYLESIFSQQMQQAIFTWGFRSASYRKQLRTFTTDSKASAARAECEPWARGLSLLREMDCLGFPVDIGAVRHAFTTRLWILLGPAFSNREINNQARRDNRLRLSQFLLHADEIWPGLIHWVPQNLLKSEHADDARLLLAFFGPVRRVSKERRDYANVAAWAKSLDSSSSEYLYEGRKIAMKASSWNKSELQLVKPPKDTHTSNRGSLASEPEHPGKEC